MICRSLQEFATNYPNEYRIAKNYMVNATDSLINQEGRLPKTTTKSFFFGKEMTSSPLSSNPMSPTFVADAQQWVGNNVKDMLSKIKEVHPDDIEAEDGRLTEKLTRSFLDVYQRFKVKEI